MNPRYYTDVAMKRLGYDFYADIAENIVSACRGNGWTQEQLAEHSKIKPSRLAAITSVRTRIFFSELTKIATALDVTELFLTGESPESDMGDCLFVVSNERVDRVILYCQAQSYGLAFLKVHEDTRIKYHVKMFEPRDRAIVQLRGVPVSEAKMQSVFPKATGTDDPLQQPEGRQRQNGD